MNRNCCTDLKTRRLNVAKLLAKWQEATQAARLRVHQKRMTLYRLVTETLRVCQMFKDYLLWYRKLHPKNRLRLDRIHSEILSLAEPLNEFHGQLILWGHRFNEYVKALKMYKHELRVNLRKVSQAKSFKDLSEVYIPMLPSTYGMQGPDFSHLMTKWGNLKLRQKLIYLMEKMKASIDFQQRIRTVATD